MTFTPTRWRSPPSSVTPRANAGSRLLFLGDAVGYYPQPEEVITTLSALPLAAALLGNHDATLLEPDAGGAATNVVTEVLGKQRKTLSEAGRTFLAQLSRRAEGDHWEAVHSTLAGSWDYVDSLARAQRELKRMSRPLLFFGHTHVPVIYLFTEHGGRWLSRSVPLTKEASSYRLPPNARATGQPRLGRATPRRCAAGVVRRLRRPDAHVGTLPRPLRRSRGAAAGAGGGLPQNASGAARAGPLSAHKGHTRRYRSRTGPGDAARAPRPHAALRRPTTRRAQAGRAVVRGAAELSNSDAGRRPVRPLRELPPVL